MRRNAQSKPFVSDPGNLKLNDLIGQLAGRGLGQQEVAELLRISPSQLSRLKLGERRASLRKHVEPLRKYLQERQHPSKPQSIFAINHANLNCLSPTEAVEAFRSLLWARATQLGIPTSKVLIPSLDICKADGGVDGCILDGPYQMENRALFDEFFANEPRFQVKTGAFQPWQKSEINRELFDGKPARFDNLDDAVKRTLRDGKRYVLVCFGIDLTCLEQEKACENLRSAFESCGFPDANVDVWSQSQLIGLFQAFPSLCLSLHSHTDEQKGFRSWSSWSSLVDMQPIAHYGPETQLLVQELRGLLRSGQEVSHVRLIGEPGVGKTRLALEITRSDEFAPVTLFVKDARALLTSSFINELIQSDDHRFVVLVVDECPPKDRAEICNALMPISKRVRLITIDHGPEESYDSRMRIVHVERLNDELIVDVLKGYGIDRPDLRHWARFCEGSPRVAHVLGENLRSNVSDILQEPSAVIVWNRFITGSDDSNSEEVHLRRVVLRHLALFERFGFAPPVDMEAKFIAGMGQNCDARLTLPRFKSIVENLKDRRILQGATTLYITPRLLHLQLYREFWQNYGSGFDIADVLRKMPPQMWLWFVRMTEFSHDVRQAEQAIDALLGYDGVFPGTEFPNLQGAGQLITALAKACPHPTLRCLKRTIGSMSVEQLHELTEPRQFIVWALECIAVREQFFVKAAELLLSLAEAENSNYGNNSTGTFTGLFSLVPGLCSTEANAAVRLTVLENALNSSSPKKRQIGLAACVVALSPRFSRDVGPEHQGLRKSFQFWMPKTYGELWDAHRDAWQLLVGKLRYWSGEERSQLISSLIRVASHLWHIAPLSTMVIETLKSIAPDPATNTKELVELIQRHVRHDRTLPEDIKNELRALLQTLEGTDFTSRLRRFVKHATIEDEFDDEGKPTRFLEQTLDQLAKECIASPELLKSELPWLVCENASAGLAYYLAKEDPARSLLPDILTQMKEVAERASTSFLSGYLCAVFQHDRLEWESLLFSMAENPVIGSRFSDYVIQSGLSDKATIKVIELCRAGIQSKKLLAQWSFRSRLKELSFEVFGALVRLQLEDESGESWSNAVEMAHTYFMEKDEAKPLPEALTFDLLTYPNMASPRVPHEVGYYWSRLAAVFLNQFPKRKWDFFECVLVAGAREWSLLLDLNTNQEQVLTKLLQENPETAWDCISHVYDEGEYHSNFGLRCWLDENGHRLPGNDSPGPIQHVPAATLFDWIDENMEDRGCWLAHVLPKTLDKTTTAGRLTRDFIARYGENEPISNSLWAHFHSRGWCGNASDHYRRLREEARQWLVGEKDLTVKRWIENYMDGLTIEMERALIEEERGF